MRILFLSLLLGLISLSTYSQSKLVGAGKTSKAGAETTPPPAPKKPVVKTTPTVKKTVSKADPDEKYASSGYMEISGISFANIDNKSHIIDDYGSNLYAGDVKYLRPKVFYRGLASEEKEITIDVKIIKEDGSIASGTNSPDGYTFSYTIDVEPGVGNSIELSGWGNNNGGSYSAGQYKFEIWYKGNILFQKGIRLYSGTTPLATSKILKISSVSFANHEKDGTAISSYGAPLYAGEVKYLTPKMYYEGLHSANQSVTLFYRIFTSDGNLSTGDSSPLGFSSKQTLTIKPGSNYIELNGWGNNAATVYSAGTTKIEYWLDGEKIYETSVTINDKRNTTYTSYGNEMDLKTMLEKPMMNIDLDPKTTSFYTLKNSLSSKYTVDDKSDDNRYCLYLYSKNNNSLQNISYHGLKLDYFYFMVRKSDSSSLQRRMSYQFTAPKTQIESLNSAYSYLDKIVSDFNNLGINISYQKKDEAYLKAKGGCRQGKIEHEVELNEYESYFSFTIYLWVFN